MKGPAPKPTVLKRLAGNPGRRPLNAAEPQPRRVHLHCPSHLSGEARQEWRRVAGDLYRLGLLTVVDMAVLASYCQAYGRWKKAERKIAETGEVATTPNGYAVQSVWLQIANKAMEQMHRFAVEFGFTPASRTRVKMEMMEKEKSLAEILFDNMEDDHRE